VLYRSKVRRKSAVVIFVAAPRGGRRLIEDPAMCDETTLPGLFGEPLRYRKQGGSEWHGIEG
jgi:hypothetical protein